jgi:DNA-binding NtrC family response regulator
MNPLKRTRNNHPVYNELGAQQTREPTKCDSTDQIETDAFSVKEIGKRAAREAETKIILEVLERTHWNRKEAARLLQVSYKALLYKIQKYTLNNMNLLGDEEGDSLKDLTNR